MGYFNNQQLDSLSARTSDDDMADRRDGLVRRYSTPSQPWMSRKDFRAHMRAQESEQSKRNRERIAMLATISAPVPCKGLNEDRRYYMVTVDGIPYRLHDEWAYGIDVQEQRIGLPDIWVGRDLDGDPPRALPAPVIAELRAMWERLMAPDLAAK